jgi:hypothetical protein
MANGLSSRNAMVNPLKSARSKLSKGKMEYLGRTFDDKDSKFEEMF